jgi:phenylalanyl-tRNA synthetase beta chain
MNCVDLFKTLKEDQKLKKFLHIIEDSPVYPVFYDQKRTVLSLPPIINSDSTKISQDTKNCFIEVTGTDLTKCKIVLAILTSQFSEHCEGASKFTVEPVDVIYEGNSDLGTIQSPCLDTESFEVEVNYITKLLGIPLDVKQINEAAVKMGLNPVASSDAQNKVKFECSPIRPDILHACDIAEEIGIGYGFNNIPMVYPPTNTVGSFIPENKFTDLLRHNIAQAGFIESLTCALVSIKENYTNLRYEPNLDEAIQLSNPKTLEYEQVRTSLIPGLLKVLQSNQNERIPQKIFEISDTAKIVTDTDTGCQNERKVCIM